MAQQVKPGDTLTIHGLKSRSELNGKKAVLIGPQGDRFKVKLESGEELALKQDNLGIMAPSSGGGGMPGFGGGMPGFGGGIPGFGGGGMPGMPPGGLPAMVEQFSAALQQRLRQFGISLPPGISPKQALIGFAIVTMVILYILSRFLTTTGLLIVGMVAYWGTSTGSGQTMLARGSAQASQALKRHVPPNAILILLCLAAGYAGHAFLSGSRSGGSQNVQDARPERSGRSRPNPNVYDDGSDSIDQMSEAIRKAYQQGYDDGVAGIEPRPPTHVPNFNRDSSRSRQDDGYEMEEEAAASQQKASSPGLGLHSLLRYGPAAYFIYNLGKTPAGWNPQAAMENAKRNPTQAIMVLVMMSGVLF